MKKIVILLKLCSLALAPNLYASSSASSSSDLLLEKEMRARLSGEGTKCQTIFELDEATKKDFEERGIKSFVEGFAFANKSTLFLVQGSVPDFKGDPEDAVVNATNQFFRGWSGIEAAFNARGGELLEQQREQLKPYHVEGYKIRTADCHWTNGEYPGLKANNIFHVVGPDYEFFSQHLPNAIPDQILSSAYSNLVTKVNKLNSDEITKIKRVAIPLVSVGVFAGERSKKDITMIGIIALIDAIAKQTGEPCAYFLFAFTDEEMDYLHNAVNVF